MERTHRKQREKRDQGKGRGTWKNGVCVPYCGSTLSTPVPPPPIMRNHEYAYEMLFASITNNREHALHELLNSSPVGCITELNITYGRANITSNFLIKLVISQTAILCSACYFSKPTDVPSSRVIFILFISHPHVLEILYSLRFDRV